MTQVYAPYKIHLKHDDDHHLKQAVNIILLLSRGKNYQTTTCNFKIS